MYSCLSLQFWMCHPKSFISLSGINAHISTYWLCRHLCVRLPCCPMDFWKGSIYRNFLRLWQCYLELLCINSDIFLLCRAGSQWLGGRPSLPEVAPVPQVGECGLHSWGRTDFSVLMLFQCHFWDTCKCMPAHLWTITVCTLALCKGSSSFRGGHLGCC